jgi:hypothetical protein
MDRRSARVLAALSILCAGALLAVQARAVPGGGTLFGTDGSSGHLIAIDPETGAGTVIGSMGIEAPSLAVDPTTGTMYAGGPICCPDLYTVDKTTGAATFVGDSGLGFAAIGALDFRKDGRLFAAVNIAGGAGTGSDHLAWIDKTTGAATIIGPFGTCTGVTVPSTGGGSCTIEGMEAIAFDTRGRLWGALNARGAAGTPGLYRINTSTGAATFVAPIVHKDTGLPPSGGVVSLQFDCENDLLGGTGRAAGQVADDGGRLIELNKRGKFRFAGPASATGGDPIAALAFDAGC